MANPSSVTTSKSCARLIPLFQSNAPRLAAKILHSPEFKSYAVDHPIDCSTPSIIVRAIDHPNMARPWHLAD